MVVRVAILDDYQQCSRDFGDWAGLSDKAEIVSFADHQSEPDALVARLRGFDVVVAMRERTPFPREVLERLDNLKLLVTTGFRNAAIDVAAASDCGVIVCGTRGYFHSTVELTWALILSLARHLVEEHNAIRANGWQHTIGRDLHGRVLGVVGLGNMGAQVAAIGRAFGMEVIAWSQNLTAEVCARHGVRLVSREDVFRTADVLSVHLQLSGERNRGLIGANELALMPSHALLVNTSRGPIVDETALIAALRDGRIGGAALDVYDLEPLPRDHPYRALPRLITTPHVGYVTANTYAVFFADVVEAISGWIEGVPVRRIEHD